MKRSDISDAEVCRAYAEMKAARSGEMSPLMVDAILMDRFAAPEKVVYAAMDRAYRRDLVEYGVSLRSGWLTEKGQALLDGEKVRSHAH